MIETLSFAFGSLALGIVLIRSMMGVLNSPRIIRRNYAGKIIPASAGIVIFQGFLLVFTVRGFFIVENPSSAWTRLLILCGSMCFFGLLDDVFGSGEEKGFRGHFLSVTRGKITTGIIKAFFGLAVCIAVLIALSEPRWEVFINAPIAALSANLFNLLDMRPGRALKVFFPALALVIYLNRHSVTTMSALCSVGGFAMALFPGDLAERFMLGDSGSNVLGATIGFGVVSGLSGNLYARVAALCFLVIANVVSEKYSFTALIEKSRALKFFDMLGRKRSESGDS